MAVFAACAAASLAWMSLVGGPALAQRPGVPQVSSTTVLIDIPYIFKHHDGLKGESEQMNADLQRLQEQFKRESEEIQKFQERLARVPPRHPRLQGRAGGVRPQAVGLPNPHSEWRSRSSPFATRKCYNRVYQEVLQEVEYYCANNNIALVMNFNGDPINPDRPNDIERMIRQPVVYHAKSIDITPIILQSIRTRHGWTDAPRTATPQGVNPNDSLTPRRAAAVGQGLPGRGRMESIPLLVMDDWPFPMDGTRNERTIAAAAAVEGIGYWSGRDVRVEFRPAPPRSGIVFVRADLPGRPRIPAAIANRSESPLRTVLRAGEAGVDMIEHVMAALAGLRIDNCEIHVNQSEMPGVDGSALPFVRALQGAGIVEQDAPRRVIWIRRAIRLGDDKSWIEARPSSSGGTTIQYELDYGSGNPIGRQSLEILLSPRFFPLNLAPSRTFLLEREAAALQAQGLGLRATFDDLLVFDAAGPINNSLRFPDECVRHKILDMIGDLALAGCDLVGKLVAYRSGHRLNGELVRAVLADEELAEQTRQRRCA